MRTHENNLRFDPRGSVRQATPQPEKTVTGRSMADPFIPSDCRTEPTPDRRYIRVIFERDEGSPLELMVATSQFSTIARAFEIQADQLGAPRSAEKSLLEPGQSVSVDGSRLMQGGGSELILTIFARVFEPGGERGITIPVPLTAQAAQTLREKLDRRLSNDEPDN